MLVFDSDGVGCPSRNQNFTASLFSTRIDDDDEDDDELGFRLRQPRYFLDNLWGLVAWGTKCLCK